jgi:hypothetical protein
LFLRLGDFMQHIHGNLNEELYMLPRAPS